MRYRQFSSFYIATWFAIVCTCMYLPACDSNNPQPAADPGDDPRNASVSLIQDEFEGIPVVVIGSPGANFIVSYQRKLDGTLLEFEAMSGTLPVIMRDNEGTEWDIFGYAVSGPREGQALDITHSFMGYWFAFASMYPGVNLYQEPPVDANVDLSGNAEWLIPPEFVFQASARDAIQSVDAPQFIEYRERDFQDGNFYVKPDDLIVGYFYNDEIKAYPHPLLDWHEIVNDEIHGVPVSVVYCPLTGTGSIWDRRTSSGTTTFGVSGLLYNNNIVPYDRLTESYWTQLDEKCVSGELIGETVSRLRSVETSWRTWISIFFKTEVITTETGFGKPYGEYPYGSYKTNHELIPYPLTYTDKRVPAKERVHCIIVNDKARVYRFGDF